jgi:pimeloyl-ACP methyl ester carboxylesterase
MALFSRRGRITPGEMFPAGEPGYRVSLVPLRSGIRVRVVERGDAGGVPVLMLPGWGSTAYAWRMNLPAVADAGYRAIAVDPKGSGLSDKPLGESEYTSDAMISHLGEILDALALENPVVVGHSQSATVAFRFAKRFPHRVRGLVLLSPVGHAGFKNVWLYKLLTPKIVRPLLPSLCTREAVRLTLHRVYGNLRPFTERVVDEYHAPCQFREFPIAQRDSLHAFDWSVPVTGPVNVPALLMHGSEDHLVRGDALADFAHAIPGIEIIEIAGAGHIIPEEAYEQVNAALTRFLRGTVPAWLY